MKKLWLEVFLMFAHYGVFAAGLKAAGCTLGAGMTYYCIGYAWQGIYLGFFFGLSHFAVEVSQDFNRNERKRWLCCMIRPRNAH